MRDFMAVTAVCMVACPFMWPFYIHAYAEWVLPLVPDMRAFLRYARAKR